MERQSRILALVAGAGILALNSAAEPGARWLPVGDALNAGESVEVICRAEWEKGAPVSGVVPADVPSLDWGTLELVRIASGVEKDAVYFDHVFALSAAAPGLHALPGLDIAYLEEDAADTENALVISAEAAEIEVRESNRALNRGALAAGATAIVAAIVVVLRTRRQRNLSSSTNDASPKKQSAREAFQRAQACRIEGDFYGCYQALSEAAERVGEDALAEAMTARAEEAGYGGARPDDASLDGDFREVQRALNRANSEPVANADLSQRKDDES